MKTRSPLRLPPQLPTWPVPSSLPPRKRLASSMPMCDAMIVALAGLMMRSTAAARSARMSLRSSCLRPTALPVRGRRCSPRNSSGGTHPSASSSAHKPHAPSGGAFSMRAPPRAWRRTLGLGLGLGLGEELELGLGIGLE